MAMAASTKKSSGADPVMGAIGGILPGVGAMTQVSQMASDPKGAAKGMGEQMAKEAMKKAAKKIAQKVAQQIAASILTNPYVLAAIGIVIVVVVVFLIIISVVTGQSGDNSTKKTTGDGIVSIDNHPPFSGNVDDYFVFSGGTQNQQNNLKDYLKIALAYPKYQTLLDIDTKGKINIVLHPGEPTGYNGGWAVTNLPNGNIDLYENYLNTDSKTQKLYLLHETAHTIDFRNKLSATFYPSGIDDSSCYDSHGYIKTYPTGQHLIEDGTVAVKESFADSFIDTLFCKPGEVCGPNGKISGDDGSIQDWPTTCTNTYNWMAKNMLGATSSNQTGDMCSGFYADKDARNSSVITTIITPQKNIYQHSGQNFGDPQCELTTSGPEAQDNIFSYLKQIDPQNATTWWTMVACESSYDPLSYNPNSHSSLGAYGLLQMNPSTNPFSGDSRTGTSDIGDVPWEQQLQNAVNIGKGEKYFSDYWGCGPHILIK